MVTEEHHTSVVSLRSMRKEVERGIVIEQEVVWSSTLTSDNVWSLDWISAEEDWEIEADNIVVTLALVLLATARLREWHTYRVELDSKTTRIARKIWKLSAKSDSRISDEDRCLGTDALQEVRLGQMGHVFRDFEVAESATTARMDHSL